MRNGLQYMKSTAIQTPANRLHQQPKSRGTLSDKRQTSLLHGSSQSSSRPLETKSGSLYRGHQASTSTKANTAALLSSTYGVGRTHSMSFAPIGAGRQIQSGRMTGTTSLNQRGSHFRSTFKAEAASGRREIKKRISNLRQLELENQSSDQVSQVSQGKVSNVSMFDQMIIEDGKPEMTQPVNIIEYQQMSQSGPHSTENASSSLYVDDEDENDQIDTTNNIDTTRQSVDLPSKQPSQTQEEDGALSSSRVAVDQTASPSKESPMRNDTMESDTRFQFDQAMASEHLRFPPEEANNDTVIQNLPHAEEAPLDQIEEDESHPNQASKPPSPHPQSERRKGSLHSSLPESPDSKLPQQHCPEYEYNDPTTLPLQQENLMFVQHQLSGSEGNTWRGLSNSTRHRHQPSNQTAQFQAPTESPSERVAHMMGSSREHGSAGFRGSIVDAHQQAESRNPAQQKINSIYVEEHRLQAEMPQLQQQEAQQLLQRACEGYESDSHKFVMYPCRADTEGQNTYGQQTDERPMEDLPTECQPMEGTHEMGGMMDQEMMGPAQDNFGQTGQEFLATMPQANINQFIDPSSSAAADSYCQNSFNCTNRPWGQSTEAGTLKSTLKTSTQPSFRNGSYHQKAFESKIFNAAPMPVLQEKYYQKKAAPKPRTAKSRSQKQSAFSSAQQTQNSQKSYLDKLTSQNELKMEGSIMKALHEKLVANQALQKQQPHYMQSLNKAPRHMSKGSVCSRQSVKSRKKTMRESQDITDADFDIENQKPLTAYQKGMKQIPKTTKNKGNLNFYGLKKAQELGATLDQSSVQNQSSVITAERTNGCGVSHNSSTFLLPQPRKSSTTNPNLRSGDDDANHYQLMNLQDEGDFPRRDESLESRDNNQHNMSSGQLERRSRQQRSNDRPPLGDRTALELNRKSENIITNPKQMNFPMSKLKASKDRNFDTKLSAGTAQHGHNIVISENPSFALGSSDVAPASHKEVLSAHGGEAQPPRLSKKMKHSKSQQKVESHRSKSTVGPAVKSTSRDRQARPKPSLSRQRNSASVGTLGRSQRSASLAKAKSQSKTHLLGVLATHMKKQTGGSPAKMATPTGGNSQISFDPMKKSIIQNHMSHKGKVTTLQLQFANQKYQTKCLLSKQLQTMKTDLTQLRKQSQQQQNCCHTLFDAKKELEVQLKKKQEKTKAAQREVAALVQNIGEIENEVDELHHVSTCLGQEISEEQKLKEEIQKICMKYKKLIVEQRKEKEKLAQQVVHQKRIAANLVNRRDRLIDDNNKIYDDFSQVVERDQEKLMNATKKSVIMLSSKEDREFIRC